MMRKTDRYLNNDARKRHDYYASRNGTALEDDVKEALDVSAKGTPFENTILKISGQKFPDIIADNLFGIEVKSTNKDHWTSTGSSILESTRVDNIERIYMTFGKLGGDPIQFLSKPYEKCLYDIAVTHMPRYLINMNLDEGQTIFDKIGIPYDELRLMDNPVAPISQYYRSKLKPGESLWWAGDAIEDETVSPTIRLWKNISTAEKRACTIYGLVNFPEIFKSDFDRYALWLTSQGIVDTHIRDQFSAGGRETLPLSNGAQERFPAIYRRVKEYRPFIASMIFQKGDPNSKEHILTPDSKLGQMIKKWCAEVSSNSYVEYKLSMDALYNIFFSNPGLSQNATIKVCGHCRMPYAQIVEKQSEGSKEIDDDLCPYCGYSNGSSMEEEYFNYTD